MRVFAEGSANEERSDKPACMVIVNTAVRVWPLAMRYTSLSLSAIWILHYINYYDKICI